MLCGIMAGRRGWKQGGKEEGRKKQMLQNLNKSSIWTMSFTIVLLLLGECLKIFTMKDFVKRKQVKLLTAGSNTQP